MLSPIDVPMLYPRTEQVGANQHFENQRVAGENAFAANQVQKEVNHASEAVVKKEDAQFEEYKYDAREEGKGTYGRPGKRKNKGGESKEKDEAKDGVVLEKDNLPPRINFDI